ncbi:hypothetical protein EYB25_003219 [Talaromyces marneffei]|nr:hypothetical protein EYB25_003219 [Talaromyces marneffei]
MSCRHISWIEVVEDRSSGEQLIINTTRLDRIIQELPDSYKQSPRLVHFIGTKNKDQALKNVFPNNNFGRQYEKGDTNLRIDNTTINTASPLLIADSNPFRGFSAGYRAQCHINHGHPISWDLDGSLIADAIFTRLLFPFSDLVCVFADDFASLESVALRIFSWMSNHNAGQEIKTQLLVVTSETGPLDSLRDEDFRSMLHYNGCDPREMFSTVKIFRLAGEYLSPPARYQRLKDQVYELTSQRYLTRKEMGYDFSFTHFAAFFDRAVIYTAKNQTPFNFITLSRLGLPSMIDDMDHVKSFLNLALGFDGPYEAIASLLASCILVDAYPYRMHQFAHKTILDFVYRDKLIEALNSSLTLDCAHFIVSRIEINLIKYQEDMQNGKTSLELHAKNMKDLAHFFAEYRTNKSCLFCLARSPERHLSCGHSICDVCIRRFGKEVTGRQDRYAVTCTLDNGKLTADLKPKTAGVRMISIDGGGTRGIAPLAFLNMVEDLMPGCPLHEQIDYAAGSSSGGLIVLGIFYRQWKPQKGKQLFLSMAERCFQRPKNAYECVQSTLRWLISDGFYDESNLESILQDMFPGRLFDHLPNTVSGTRFALTATSTGNSRWIFGNYNAEIFEPRNDYEMVRVDNVQHEVYAWEAGRATSAAPVFFKPIQIYSGTYWDGGLVFPDPVRLAMFESERLWPESIPDVVISLGTGIQPKTKGDRNSLHRLWAGFMDMLDGQSHSRDTEKGLERYIRGSFFRLNTILQRPIRLDNLKDLEELSRAVHISPKSRRDTENVFGITARRFYVAQIAKLSCLH